MSWSGWGEGPFARVEQAGLVAFQVDGETGGDDWSVLVRGLALAEDEDGGGGALPVPGVASPWGIGWSGSGPTW